MQPHHQKNVYRAVFEIQLLTWSTPYAGDTFFCQKTTDFARFEGVECIPALHSLYDIDNSWDNIIPRLKLGDNQI
jgi:hypothetical protein